MLRLQVKLRQHRDLDGTGLSEDFVFAEIEVVSAGEVLDGYSHDAVEVGVDFVDRGFEFLPEDLALFGGRRGRLRCGDGDQEKNAEEMLEGHVSSGVDCSSQCPIWSMANPARARVPSALNSGIAQLLNCGLRTHRRIVNLFKGVRTSFRSEDGKNLDVPVVVLIDGIPVTESF